MSNFKIQGGLAFLPMPMTAGEIEIRVERF